MNINGHRGAPCVHSPPRSSHWGGDDSLSWLCVAVWRQFSYQRLKLSIWINLALSFFSFLFFFKVFSFGASFTVAWKSSCLLKTFLFIVFFVTFTKLFKNLKHHIFILTQIYKHAVLLSWLDFKVKCFQTNLFFPPCLIEIWKYSNFLKASVHFHQPDCW